MKMFNIIYKKTIGILLVAVLAVSIGGCEAVFDQSLARVSDSRLTFENVMDDADKIEGLFNSCYAGIPKHRGNIHNAVTFESLADNAFDDKTGGSLGKWYRGELSPSQSALKVNPGVGTTGTFGAGGSFWGIYWGAIRACNILINHMDEATAPEEDLALEYRAAMVEEARILRAHYHIQLLGMYGPVPFITEDYTVNYEGWETMKRPDFHDVAVAIANDLQEVIDNGIVPLRRDGDIITDKYRVPLAYAYGLKSRILLYSASPLYNPTGDKAKYTLAAEAAKQFIDLGEYSLEPFENTKKALYNSPISARVEDIEVIWRSKDPFKTLSHTGGMDLAKAMPGVIGATNWARVGETPTQEMVDAYELKTGELIIANYNETHEQPTFTDEALAAGYDDVNDPYANRDARFYRDILFNGNYFGQSYDNDSLYIYTYSGFPGTGNNGAIFGGQGDKKQTYTGYYFGKDRDPIYYGKRKHQADCRQHSILMRFAEIYLNYAEALCGAGEYALACDALDQTRLRALQPSIKDVPGAQPNNKEWLMKRIYNERRIELVLEDHRFFDVRRWDIISDVNYNAISGMLAEKVADDTYTYSRYQIADPWACHNERYKVLPIPAEDQKKMPLMLQPEAWR